MDVHSLKYIQLLNTNKEFDFLLYDQTKNVNNRIKIKTFG